MKQSRVGPAYVVCIDDADYPASLEKHKIYRVIDDDAAASMRAGPRTNAERFVAMP